MTTDGSMGNIVLYGIELHYQPTNKKTPIDAMCDAIDALPQDKHPLLRCYHVQDRTWLYLWAGYAFDGLRLETSAGKTHVIMEPKQLADFHKRHMRGLLADLKKVGAVAAIKQDTIHNHHDLEHAIKLHVLGEPHH